MSALSLELFGLGQPLMLIALISLVLGLLQAERLWTRSRRARGASPGAIAYVLDGLAIIGILLALVAAVALLGSTLISAAAVVGGAIDGQRVGLLIVGMALALGLAWVLARAASGRRANRAVAGTNALATLPINSAEAAETRLAIGAEQGLAPQYEQIEAQPPLVMMQERWQPRTPIGSTAPVSFLDLIEPQAKKPERSRFAVVPTLLVLALVVMVVSGSVLFRHQLINVLAGMEASYGNTAAAGAGASLAQPDTSSAAANVGAAAASVVSAPTAATVAAPTAAVVAVPATTSEGQGIQKHVKGSGLNLRAQPGIDQQVVAVLRQGDVVTVFTDARLIQGATWVRVRAGDVEGWVDQSFLE